MLKKGISYSGKLALALDQGVYKLTSLADGTYSILHR